MDRMTSKEFSRSLNAKLKCDKKQSKERKSKSIYWTILSDEKGIDDLGYLYHFKDNAITKLKELLTINPNKEDYYFIDQYTFTENEAKHLIFND